MVVGSAYVVLQTLENMYRRCGGAGVIRPDSVQSCVFGTGLASCWSTTRMSQAPADASTALPILPLPRGRSQGRKTETLTPPPPLFPSFRPKSGNSPAQLSACRPHPPQRLPPLDHLEHTNSSFIRVVRAAPGSARVENTPTLYFLKISRDASRLPRPELEGGMTAFFQASQLIVSEYRHMRKMKNMEMLSRLGDLRYRAVIHRSVQLASSRYLCSEALLEPTDVCGKTLRTYGYLQVYSPPTSTSMYRWLELVSNIKDVGCSLSTAM